MASIPIFPAGEYNLSVVGESYYRESIAKHISRDHDVVTGKTQVKARLVPESSNPLDGKAIRVEINSDRVGYLSKEEALRIHNLYQQHACPRNTILEVSAEIRGYAELASDYGIVLDVSDNLLIEQLKIYAVKNKKESTRNMILLALVVALPFIIGIINEILK